MMMLSTLKPARPTSAIRAAASQETASPVAAPPRKQKVAGPTAIITGGSQGVGKALGELLASNGYNVVLAARQPERLQAAAEGCQRRASRADALSMAVPCDITQPGQVTSLAERVFDTYTSVNLVVNNAGVCMRGDWNMCTLDDYQDQLNVNFLGTVAVSQAFLPALEEAAAATGQSTLAVVNSFAARLPIKEMAAYTASKAALAGWVDAVRPELAPKGIHVAQIHPGVIRSDFLERAQFRGGSASAAAAQMRSMLDAPNMPLVQTPEQVAAAVVDAVTNRNDEVMVGLPFAALQAAYRTTGLNVFSY